MDIMELYSIGEREIDLINPSSKKKIVAAAVAAGFRDNIHILDFGSGYAEPLLTWSEHWTFTATGIDVRENVCQKARSRIEAAGLEDRLQIICGDGSAFTFDVESCQVAICLGASFIWGGFLPTLQALKRFISPGGSIIIGEPYWIQEPVPPEIQEKENSILREQDILKIIHSEGYELVRIFRSNHDEWDEYETKNWHGLFQWLQKNPDHKDWGTVYQRLHEVQEDYLGYARQHIGWAIFVLRHI